MGHQKRQLSCNHRLRHRTLEINSIIQCGVDEQLGVRWWTKVTLYAIRPVTHVRYPSYRKNHPGTATHTLLRWRAQVIRYCVFLKYRRALQGDLFNLICSLKVPIRVQVRSPLALRIVGTYFHNVPQTYCRVVSLLTYGGTVMCFNRSIFCHMGRWNLSFTNTQSSPLCSYSSLIKTLMEKNLLDVC